MNSEVCFIISGKNFGATRVVKPYHGTSVFLYQAYTPEELSSGSMLQAQYACIALGRLAFDEVCMFRLVSSKGTFPLCHCYFVITFFPLGLTYDVLGF